MTRGDLLGRPDRWARLLGWAAALGLLCGVIGPFGSYPASGINRITYWIGLCVGGTIMLWPIVATALSTGLPRHYPAAFLIAAGVLIGCVPLAAVAAMGGHLLWPLHASGIRAIEWYGQTACLALPTAGGLLWLELFRHDGHAAPPTVADAAPAGLVHPARLPDYLGETALCLQMEDHHIRVHGAAGSRPYLATMREAVARLDGRHGMQVHRSWWVAAQALVGCVEDGRSVYLILTNGLRVPIARNRVAAVRARGWLGEARSVDRSSLS